MLATQAFNSNSLKQQKIYNIGEREREKINAASTVEVQVMCYAGYEAKIATSQRNEQKPSSLENLGLIAITKEKLALDLVKGWEGGGTLERRRGGKMGEGEQGLWDIKPFVRLYEQSS